MVADMSGSVPTLDPSAAIHADQAAAASVPPPTPAPPSAPQRPSRLRRWGRRLLLVVACVLGLWALAWLGVPPLLKWQAEKQASAALGRAVHIGAVDFKPWTLELTVSDLSVAGPPGAQADLLKVKRVYVDAELQSLMRLAPVIDAIQVDAPELHLAYLGDGHYDVDDIRARLAAQPQAAEPGKPQRFALYNIKLTNGHIAFDDRVVGRQHEITNLNLALPFISNLPAERSIQVQPQLAFVVNGSAFDSKAQALPFDDSRKVDAAFKLSQLDLKPYLGYIPAGLPLQLQAATVDADVRLGFEQTPKPSLRVGGTVAVSGLKAADAQGADALAFDALKIDLGDVRPLEREVHLASVALQGPQVAVRRYADGRFNLQPQPAVPNASNSIADGADPTSASGQNGTEKAVAASAPASPAAAVASATSAASTATVAQAAPTASAASAAASAASAAMAAQTAPSAWKVLVDKISVQGGAVDFTDDTAAQGGQPAAAVRLNAVTLNAADLTWPMAKPAAFDGSLMLAGAQSAPAAAASAAAPEAAASAAGDAAQTLRFEGQASTQGAQWSAQVNAVPLRLAAPYLAPYLVPQLTGQLDARLNGEWAPPAAPDQPTTLKLAAERLALSQLLLAHTGAQAGARGGDAAGQPQPAAASKNSPGKAGRSKSVAGKATGAAAAKAGGKTKGKAPAKGAGKGTRTSVLASAPGLASVAQVELQQVQVDLASREVTVGRLGVQAPRARLARDADGRWMYQDWLRQPPASSAAAPKESDKTAAPAAPWRWSVNEAVVDGGAVGWHDEAVRNDPVDVELSQLRVEVKPLDLASKKPLAINLSTRVGAGDTEPGLLEWRGSVALEPLAVQGQLNAQRLPAHAFEPYADGLVNIDVLRADTSFKGDVGYTQTAQGPRVRVKGDAALEDMRTHGRSPPTGAVPMLTPNAATTGHGATSHAALAPAANAVQRRSGGGGLGDELLSWKLLRVAGLDVQLEPQRPLRLNVNSVLLSDFYARLIIQPDGRLALQDVVKPGQGGGASAPGAAPADAASAAPASTAPAAVASATLPTAKPDPMAPVIRIGPIKLASGRVYFSDRFIKPNYSADLTELNGSLSEFSSIAPASGPQMAELQLTGRAQGTAGLEVNGKLNPLAKPLALDVRAKVSDLDLPPLTPYTIKYAGHGIERGKLSVDVNYAIQPNGQLTATNKIVLHQLEFGEPVPGAPASLPVKLATALLADSNGVIDLDLPISGSLNDPQFSLGPIIVKAIFNIIGKAITAPFTLLARSLGGSSGEDMSMVPFASGSARLDDKTRGQLDKIAGALKQRKQLKLTVVGTANLDAEREGIRRARLKAMVLAERRGASGGVDAPAPAASAAPAASVAAPAASAAVAASAPVSGASGAQPTSAGGTSDAQNMADAEYATLLKRVYRRADIPGKPRNTVGLLRDLPVPEMEALLLAHIDVEDDAARQLAVQRATAVKDYLSSKQVPVEQVFIGAPRTGAQALEAPAGAASGAASATAAASAPAASAASAASAAAAGASTSTAGGGWTPRATLNLSAR